MLLDSNTEKVMNLALMVDDLKGIDKIRLAIHILGLCIRIVVLKV